MPGQRDKPFYFKELEMPKLKTKSGAKKRFKVTGTGKIVAKAAHARHMMMNKPKQMKRKARGTFVLAPVDARIIRENFLRYAGKVKRRKPANQNSQTAKPTAQGGK
jgi:large subunit ribosomal protein L35